MRLITGSVILAISLSSGRLLAIDDGEHMEVTAPNECCAALPGGLGMLGGWVGAAGGGAATLKEAALKGAVKTAARQKTKAQEKKEKEQQEQNEFNELTNNNAGVLQTLIHEIGLTARAAMDGGSDWRAVSKGSDGEETRIEDCVPGGPLHPNPVVCTEKKLEIFTDPTDGFDRWAFTIAVVVGKYNPKHYDATSSGYYAEVVDKQSFTLVFETIPDLIWQLQHVAAAK